MNVTEIPNFHSDCVGCGSCVCSCYSNALKIEINEEGFYYPIINKSKCINCGLCVKHCPLTKTVKESHPMQIFTAYATSPDIRNAGSSGGIMVIFSKKILSLNGIVYGAAFNTDSQEIIHSSTETYTIEQLSRSKYVQSRLDKVYKTVQQNLNNKQTVLFCGTPCQILGLKTYLKKNYENLYTIDFFCHGVPSAGLFRDLIKYYETKHQKKIKNITFREKKHGWRELYMYIYFVDDTYISFKSTEHYYYYYFLKNYSLRRSCYNCSLYNRHISDITLADNWNATNDDNKGISLILVNSDKGIELFNSVVNETTILSNPKKICFNMYRHKYSLKKRKKFFKVYKSKDFSYLAEKFYLKEKFRNDLILNIKKFFFN